MAISLLKLPKLQLLSLVALLVTGSFTSCKKSEFQDDKIVNALQPNTSNALRLDGYYSRVDSGIGLVENTFFYQNGITLNVRGAEATGPELDAYIRKEILSNSEYKNFKGGWGLYLIDGNNLKMESFFGSQFNIRSYTKTGTILNDTTFRLTRSMRSNGTEEMERNELYRFRAFSPKPDSSNKYIP